MSWEQIESIKNSPLIQVGSHTMTHRDLDRTSEEGTWWELGRSKDALQVRLGIEVRHFSYPRGIMTPYAIKTAGTLYQTAVSIFEGNDIFGGREHALMKIKRIPIQRSDGRNLFGPRIRGWLAAEGLLKKAAGRH
jgi:peptidoglycan/xylan/chitin deacetylase (PgdA/CDA1 family)